MALKHVYLYRLAGSVRLRRPSDGVISGGVDGPCGVGPGLQPHTVQRTVYRTQEKSER